jgi:hypothetical protein
MAAPTEVLGAGWATTTQAGAALTGRRLDFPALDGLAGLWNQTALFGRPVKNYGRFDLPSRLVCAACALALQDAGVPPDGARRDVALLGTSADGCLDSNGAYFRDYVAGGRILARANLFLYTLPSSPLGEVAVHFGLEGPLLYVGLAAPRLPALARTAELLLANRECQAALVVEHSATEAVALCFGERGASDGRGLGTVDDVAAALGRCGDAGGAMAWLQRRAENATR